MDRGTVLRHSEPSSRATLLGEPTNPWDLLPPKEGRPLTTNDSECLIKRYLTKRAYQHRSTQYPSFTVLRLNGYLISFAPNKTKQDNTCIPCITAVKALVLTVLTS